MLGPACLVQHSFLPSSSKRSTGCMRARTRSCILPTMSSCLHCIALHGVLEPGLPGNHPIMYSSEEE